MNPLKILGACLMLFAVFWAACADTGGLAFPIFFIGLFLYTDILSLFYAPKTRQCYECGSHLSPHQSRCLVCGRENKP